MIYIPDKWLLVKISPKGEDSIYKVFATWGGRYLDGDSWRLNSGIVKITEDERTYTFLGYSGSEYICQKDQYGTTAYGAVILRKFIERLTEETEHQMFILSKEDALNYIKENL